jgi:hypothetical protein
LSEKFGLSGAVEQPMGNRSFGRILYLKNGQMSAQVMGSAIHLLANADPDEATPDEASRAWRNYVGYWGTYHVDLVAGLVIHSVEGAWFPNWVGQKQVRQYRFAGDRLTLEADSPAWHRRTASALNHQNVLWHHSSHPS